MHKGVALKVPWSTAQTSGLRITIKLT